jgi:hypothetical protein
VRLTTVSRAGTSTSPATSGVVSCLATSVAGSPDAALAISDLAAADAYYAITSERPYKPAAPPRAGVELSSPVWAGRSIRRSSRRSGASSSRTPSVELLDGRTGVVRVDRGSPDVRTVRLQGADGPVERWPSTGCASSPPERRGGPRARVPP